MKDNKGFSLIEVIVVVTILIIISTAGLITVSIITGRGAQQCANQLQSTLMNCRNSSMGKKSVEINFSSDSDGVYYCETIDGTSKGNIKIANKGVTLSTSFDGANYTDMSSCSLNFERSSGALNQIDGIAVTSDFYIKCSQKNRSYVIKIYHLTGRAVVDE